MCAMLVPVVVVPVVVVPVVVVCELVLATGSELALTSRQTRTDTICDIFTILLRLRGAGAKGCITRGSLPRAHARLRAVLHVGVHGLRTRPPALPAGTRARARVREAAAVAPRRVCPPAIADVVGLRGGEAELARILVGDDLAGRRLVTQPLEVLGFEGSRATVGLRLVVTVCVLGLRLALQRRGDEDEL